MLGGQDRFPGLHLGGADKALLPLRRQTLVPGSQIGRFLVRLGLVAGGDRRRLLAGFFQQGVRLRFRVGIQPLDMVSIPFIVESPFLQGSGADVDDHQHGGQQGENGVELHGDAQHHALGPVVRLLGQNVDGRGGHAALRDGGEQAAQRHRQAGHEILAALGDGQLGQGPRQQAHTEDGEEPDHQAIQALGAGDHLKDHHLTEFAGILTQKAGARLTGQAGALCGADAGEDCRQASAQQRQGQTPRMPPQRTLP